MFQLRPCTLSLGCSLHEWASLGSYAGWAFWQRLLPERFFPFLCSCPRLGSRWGQGFHRFTFCRRISWKLPERPCSLLPDLPKTPFWCFCYSSCWLPQSPIWSAAQLIPANFLNEYFSEFLLFHPKLLPWNPRYQTKLGHVFLSRQSWLLVAPVEWRYERSLVELFDNH